MTKKKSKGWTFIFSLLPGAGEMYMGFMKQGISLMGLFFGVTALGAWLQLGPLLIVLPIIWCYSFFNVHNIRGLSDEEFYALEDDYVFHMDKILSDKILPKNKKNKRQNKILAAILIIAGVCILWHLLVDYVDRYIYSILPNMVAQSILDALYTVPQFVVALILIIIGIRLVKGKKVELEEKEGEES